MADQFNTYDKSPIVGNTITFRAWRFGVRELVLALVALLLLFLCLVLAGLLGDSSEKLQEARAGAMVAERTCRDSSCLKTTAHIMELLNVSARPCDNFFRFACGGYQVKNPVDEYTLYQTILKQMYQENQDRLMELLRAPAERFMTWSSELKLKDFFTSCTDDFRREKLKGRPLLDQVFPELGDWYVTDPNWSGDGWNLNDPLKKVQTEFWIDALYAPWPVINQFDSRNGIIAV